MVKLDKRLSSVAELVPPCSMAADIGSDHGYLAIHLVQSGKAEKAVAADVNRQPLEASARNIEKEGAFDKVVTRLSNGLMNVCDLNPDAVIMAGMGGELIYSIIKDAPSDYCKREKPFIVIQPMSSVYELCCLLAEDGFEIEDERLSFSSGKLYRAMRIRYTGICQKLSLLELHVGKLNLSRGGELTLRMVGSLKKKYEKIIKGKSLSDVEGQLPDLDFEREMLNQIEEYLKREETVG